MPQLDMFYAMELLGTVAFACSGAVMAIRKRLDLLGVVVLGEMTAVGGGMLRDILIGVTPPTLFVKPVYVLAAFLAVVILFSVVRFQHFTMAVLLSERADRILNLMDAIGLGAFTVTGIDTAIANGYGEYRFLVVFLGVITGVGGGILRDIMAGETPAVLKKHIYACASLAGALCYVWTIRPLGNSFAMVASAALVVIIRVLARHYKWNLPRAM